MSKVIEAPERNFNDEGCWPKIFMAGGITGCEDWQSVLIEKFSNNKSILLLNPRRKNFPIGKPDEALKQIVWEHDMLKASDAILYWFSKETLNPIVLYELGYWSNPFSTAKKPIFVGVDPEYKRKQDVEIQTSLCRPEVHIQYSLDDLVLEINKYYRWL